MFYMVPIIEGVLDIDYNFMLEGIMISAASAYVKMREGHIVRESWVEITQAEFDAVRPPDIPYQPHDDRLTQLEQVIDTLLTGGVMP